MPSCLRRSLSSQGGRGKGARRDWLSITEPWIDSQRGPGDDPAVPPSSLTSTENRAEKGLTQGPSVSQWPSPTWSPRLLTPNPVLSLPEQAAALQRGVFTPASPGTQSLPHASREGGQAPWVGETATYAGLHRAVLDHHSRLCTSVLGHSMESLDNLAHVRKISIAFIWCFHAGEAVHIGRRAKAQRLGRGAPMLADLHGRAAHFFLLNPGH